MFLAGEFSGKIQAVICWVQGGFYGFGLWEVEMLWVWVTGVTLVFTATWFNEVRHQREHVAHITKNAQFYLYGLSTMGTGKRSKKYGAAIRLYVHIAGAYANKLTTEMMDGQQCT